MICPLAARPKESKTLKVPSATSTALYSLIFSRVWKQNLMNDTSGMVMKVVTSVINTNITKIEGGSIFIS